MSTLLLTFLIIAAAIAIMSVGVLLGRKPVQGSCGGLQNIEGIQDCEICGGSVQKCRDQKPGS